MTPASAIEAIIITVVVAVSTVIACYRLFPGASSSLQSRLAHWLDAPHRPTFVRRVGRRLTPAGGASVSCATATGCSACGGCASAVPARNDVVAQPLKWHAPRGSHREI